VTAFLDLADPSFSATGPEVRSAREQDWWARTGYGIAVLRYAEVRALLADRRLAQGSAKWPAHNGVDSGPFVEWWSRTLLNLEGDAHHRLRRLLVPAFAPRHVTPLVPRFHALAEELIDGFADAGRCEFMSAFAEPYASRVATMVLGLPDEEAEQCAAWSTDLGLALGVHIARDLPRVEAALEGLYGYADDLVAARRREPGDDAVTRLLEVLDDDDELRVSIVLLVFGAIDTTRNQLGLAMATFLEHPDQWALLAERPELASQAVDEALRFEPITPFTARIAMEDVEYRDVLFPEGTVVLVCAFTGNRDGEPDGFDITAERKGKPLTFGAGIHYCLGANLARAELQEALNFLAPRTQGLALDGEPQYGTIDGIYGLDALPIRWQ
jgi:cytochrome P450